MMENKEFWKRFEENRPGPPWWLPLCFAIPSIIISVVTLLGR